jgi:hypothetical protein
VRALGVELSEEAYQASPDIGRLLHRIDIGGEADGPALRYWHLRLHQLADRREDGADGAIVLGEFFIQSGLELREAP